MTDTPRGTGAGGREDPMTATRLRECLAALGWTQRELSSILDFRDDSTVRAMARGKSRVWPILAEWLERLTAFQGETGFPIGILWWSEDYFDAFSKAMSDVQDPFLRNWLRDVILFFQNNRWPAADWKTDKEAHEDGAEVSENLRVLGLRLYGDVGRALRLDMREAKAWQRRPRFTQGEVMDWLAAMADYKRESGFPIEIFCLNSYLTARFTASAAAPGCSSAAAGWMTCAVEFYLANKTPEGFELALEQVTDEGFGASTVSAPRSRPPGS